MYKIEKKNYGYWLEFGNRIDADEMKQWYEESKKKLAESPDSFGVFVDMRTLKPLPKDAQPFMEMGQKHYKEMGMERSVVILDNPVITLQFKRIATETGIDQWERYIDAQETQNWEEVGLAWIVDGKDPDLS